jgi:hypothetical protein
VCALEQRHDRAEHALVDRLALHVAQRSQVGQDVLDMRPVAADLTAREAGRQIGDPRLNQRGVLCQQRLNAPLDRSA